MQTRPALDKLALQGDSIFDPDLVDETGQFEKRIRTVFGRAAVKD